jgi:MscS family membrane protein
VLLLAASVVPARAQGRNLSGAQSPPQAAPEQVADPLGRTTPRGAIAGLNRAVARGDLVSARRYLQITGNQGASAETLARNLTDLMDRYFTQGIMSIEDTPEGALDDGLPPNRERAATLVVGDRSINIDLVRVNEPPVGSVWLIAAETLAQVPAIHRSMEPSWLERLVPDAVSRSTILGIPIAPLVVWAVSLAIPFLAIWLLSAIFSALVRRSIRHPARLRLFDAWDAGLRWPIVLVLTLAVHFGVIRFVGFSLRFRFVYARFGIALLIIALGWLVWRFSVLSFAHARLLAQRRGEAGVSSLLLLAERAAKAVIVMVAAIALLSVAGVDTTTAIAGVGIGGVAIALGAQKSVENLLGGIFLLSDKALAIGDTCSIANRLGVIEDITLRSVRLRTLEQTLLSVPAGILAQESVENFATRQKILARSTLRLRYGTTADQLRSVLTGVRALLQDHPDIETVTSRVRLVDFGDRAIELELFAYILTADMSKFLAVREELLLQIARIVESSGSGFAQPPPYFDQGGEPEHGDPRARLDARAKGAPVGSR